MKLYGFEQMERTDARILESYQYEAEKFVVAQPDNGWKDRLMELIDEDLPTLVLQQDIDGMMEEMGCDYLLLIWSANEEEQLLFVSHSKTIRAIEFLDYMIEVFGLVKGDAKQAYGRITTAILQVQMSAKDILYTFEYFLKMVSDYHTECDTIFAKEYGITHREEILRMPIYKKRRIPWAYVKSTDVIEAGKQLTMKSLENESGITVTASSDTYVMIGCRGEIYDITKDKFHKTYEETEEPLDIFEQMLDFIPAVETVPEGAYVGLDEVAHLCYPKTGTGIYACEILKRTKIFPADDRGEYFLGRPGDYIAVRLDDLSDIYIIQGDIFLETYENQ